MDAKDLDKIEYYYAAYRGAQTAELRRMAQQNLQSVMGANLTDIIKACRHYLQTEQ